MEPCSDDDTAERRRAGRAGAKDPGVLPRKNSKEEMASHVWRKAAEVAGIIESKSTRAWKNLVCQRVREEAVAAFPRLSWRPVLPERKRPDFLTGADWRI